MVLLIVGLVMEGFAKSEQLVSVVEHEFHGGDGDDNAEYYQSGIRQCNNVAQYLWVEGRCHDGSVLVQNYCHSFLVPFVLVEMEFHPSVNLTEFAAHDQEFSEEDVGEEVEQPQHLSPDSYCSSALVHWSMDYTSLGRLQQDSLRSKFHIRLRLPSVEAYW